MPITRTKRNPLIQTRRLHAYGIMDNLVLAKQQRRGQIILMPIVNQQILNGSVVMKEKTQS